MQNCLRNFVEGWRVLELYTPVETEVCCFSFQANFFQDSFEQHPLVRVQPVIGEKAFCINGGFTRHTVGFMKEESDYLLKFLSDHLTRKSDLHIRASYEPRTIVI